jgi:hypothetical protein
MTLSVGFAAPVIFPSAASETAATTVSELIVLKEIPAKLRPTKE